MNPSLAQWVKVPRIVQLWLKFNPLAWEFPYAMGMAIKKKKKKVNKKQGSRIHFFPQHWAAGREICETFVKNESPIEGQ